MAVTVTKAAPATTVKPHWVGSFGKLGTDVYIDAPSQRNAFVRVTQLTLSGTYVTGGFALTPSDYGLKEIHGMAVICDGSSGGVAFPNLLTPGTSPTVKLVTDAAGTEYGNGSATVQVFTAILYGK